MKSNAIVLIAFLSVCSAVARAQQDSVWGIVKDGVTLDEIAVKTDRNNNEVQMKLPQNTIKLDKNFLEKNYSGSLMQTLSIIPGVKSMNIGSCQSKPVIRGLGFNRLAVIENGIKHQGQQWGHEHGLEISQFGIEDIEIIKGPSAMLYGSDAIGGVICFKNNALPEKSHETQIDFFARSNNRSLGFAAQTEGKVNKFFYKADFTFIKYSDYIVPVDSIQYYSYYIKLKDRRLRNTAGNEQDFGVTLGFNGKKLRTALNFSNVCSESGFFANAHGIEIRLSKIDFDKSFSDIDYPRSTANHFKAVSNSTLKIGRSSLNLDFAFQSNRRKEYSEPVSHGYMPKPDGFLERSFLKNTYTFNANYKFIIANQGFEAGVNNEFQNNNSGGWGFILPCFKTFGTGYYFGDKIHLSDNLIISLGVRADFSRTEISEYRDWYETPLKSGGSEFVKRSENLKKNYRSFIYSVGINYENSNWVLKGNLGKSFRMPLPVELGADGVNYQIFRYEKGNPDLDPEISYQGDFGINFQKKALTVYCTPFVNYFPNYIFLNPDFRYVEGLQLYEYVQNKVLRLGGEFQAVYVLKRKAEFTFGGEYLHSRQLSGGKKGYGLPFAQPWSVFNTAKYFIPQRKKQNECYVSLTLKYTGAQNDIVPPEKPTDGYFLTDFSAGKKFCLKKTVFNADFFIENLFNTVYYNHTSYYRLIDVPEAGVNFSVKLSLNF